MCVFYAFELYFIKNRLRKRWDMYTMHPTSDAGWSSLVARRAHNPKVVGSNPAPATNFKCQTVWRLK